MMLSTLETTRQDHEIMVQEQERLDEEIDLAREMLQRKAGEMQGLTEGIAATGKSITMKANAAEKKIKLIATLQLRRVRVIGHTNKDEKQRCYKCKKDFGKNKFRAKCIMCHAEVCNTCSKLDRKPQAYRCQTVKACRDLDPCDMTDNSVGKEVEEEEEDSVAEEVEEEEEE